MKIIRLLLLLSGIIAISVCAAMASPPAERTFDWLVGDMSEAFDIFSSAGDDDWDGQNAEVILGDGEVIVQGIPGPRHFSKQDARKLKILGWHYRGHRTWKLGRQRIRLSPAQRRIDDAIRDETHFIENGEIDSSDDTRHRDPSQRMWGLDDNGRPKYP